MNTLELLLHPDDKPRLRLTLRVHEEALPGRHRVVADACYQGREWGRALAGTPWEQMKPIEHINGRL